VQQKVKQSPTGTSRSTYKLGIRPEKPASTGTRRLPLEDDADRLRQPREVMACALERPTSDGGYTAEEANREARVAGQKQIDIDPLFEGRAPNP
jgi:hypothetical protein